jgi:hypothetical protein
MVAHERIAWSGFIILTSIVMVEADQCVILYLTGLWYQGSF